MSKYYSDSLSGSRLKLCYDLAPLRVQQYLSEEINAVRKQIRPCDFVLELGCGYGRVLNELTSETDFLFGIDTSLKSLNYGRKTYLKTNVLYLSSMDAINLGFHNDIFDLVFCIQNGISAFAVKPILLLHEALRVTKPFGKILLSSYSEKFWSDRLEWFQIQSGHGLIGEIDYKLTAKDIIICKDGFKATTFNHNQFEELLLGIEKEYKIFEIDESSLFCEIVA